MKQIWIATACAALLAGTSLTQAQFIAGNEAVQALPDGSKRVETPPLPKSRLSPPCPAAKPGCAGGGWLMLETSEGLRECTELYARPTTCRASTYGSEKRSRVWIVKSAGQWLQCQRPDLTSKCVSTKALPFSAVQ